MKFKIIRDKYTIARGKPKILKLICRKCKRFICYYQKDGSGNLYRLYLDRIEPNKPTKGIKENWLVCESCGRWLGVPSVYKKEKRLCIKLFAGAIETDEV